MTGGDKLSATGACLNPAIAFGTSIAMLLNQGGTGLRWIWLYCSLPFAGAILGVSFHEFLYKKFITSYKV